MAIIIDIIGLHIVFALQSQDFMNHIKSIDIDLISPLQKHNQCHLDKRLSKWSPLLHNISKDNCCRPRIFIVNSFC